MMASSERRRLFHSERNINTSDQSFHDEWNSQREIDQNIHVGLPTKYDPSIAPNPEHILAKGFILSRISRRTMIKSWQQTYFARYGACNILLFKSVSDYEDWLLNPDLTAKKRQVLIKEIIDFMPDSVKGNEYGISKDRVWATEAKLKFCRSISSEDMTSNLLKKIMKKKTSTEGSALVESFTGSPSSVASASSNKKLFSFSNESESDASKTVTSSPKMWQFKLLRVVEGQESNPSTVGAFGSALREEFEIFLSSARACAQYANTTLSR
mmetsp:Transcript_14392/g.31521  ORF Transcript_14392/g.31521 Transcript_14392/m.31521 type:complete len:269 (-) Transcript_14392:355-1161(-)